MSEELIDIIGQKHAITLLLAIRNKPGMTQKEATSACCTNPTSTTYRKRIHELTDAGLIRVDQDDRAHNRHRLYLTNKGQKVASNLDLICTKLTKLRPKV